MRPGEWKGFKGHFNCEWGSRLCRPKFVYSSRKTSHKSKSRQTFPTPDQPHPRVQSKFTELWSPQHPISSAWSTGNWGTATLTAKDTVYFTGLSHSGLREDGCLEGDCGLWIHPAPRCTGFFFYFRCGLQKYPRISSIHFAYWKQVWGTAPATENLPIL